MKKYFLILAAFFAAGISGCKKDYLSLETNPNTPSATTPQLTLAAALNATAANISTQYSYYGVWAGYWTTSGNYVPNSTVNQYQFTPTSFQGDWTSWYANLTNFNALQVLASKDPALANYQAIAMIMKAYGFEVLVDNYNDVPYSQAFQPSTIVFPVYDKGIDIYHDLGKQLDAAIALIGKSGTATIPGADDIVYGGKMAAWAAFANTLKLKLAIRVSTKTPSDPLVADLASTASAGYIDGATNPEAIVNPGYSNQSGKQNPFYATYGYDATGNPVFGQVYYRANAFCVNMLNNFNDPRVNQLYLPVPSTGVVRGNVFGDPNVKSNSFTSAIGLGLEASASQGEPIFSAAESLFLQAEAANNGFITGDAQTLYQAGITASFTDLGLTAAQAATYYGQAINNVGWTSSPNKEQAIITQKWISLNGFFNFEGYNEYRRTGYPALPSSIDPAAISQTLPTRIPYPQSELNTNAGNLSKEGAINYFSSKIFWAQ
jgi:hypothetical protein